MTAPDQSSNHIGTHASHPNHSKLHRFFVFHYRVLRVLWSLLFGFMGLSRLFWGLPLRVRCRCESPFCHKRKPPRKAFALLPGRQPGGSFFSWWILPPPKTT